ncbi:uncharacterized protein BJ212DRAFT_1376498 [Suillus subaureus]|uniref:Uncharacterized protein n=1 Tax=Suillus subaureus TaxID=48587 RepID=A0A9P7E4C9_9AGAM|nr:uncharacterized protein BJ212DRAFT_1376498 [Suillus subaureus]KAG1810883.1 hypothetical protein BJ212DRAFT_1376498 [Suillus subaureus]
MLRTCALWKHNRFVLVFILGFFPVAIIACTSTALASLVTTSYVTSAIPGITGCYNTDNFFVPFLLFFILELGLMSLILIHAIRSWRMARGRLYAVLVKNNIFIMHAVCYHVMFQDLQFIILAILALRMHLHFWQIDQQPHNMDAFVCISLSDM